MKLNTIKTAVIVFGMAILGSTSAFAQKGERREPPTFEKLVKEMDANEDGKLAKDEVKGPLSENFDTIDANEDGFISEEEFEKAPKPKRPSKR
ncbi:EF-hand domain-containing protein [Aurantibacter crassamenti]|uniref:EF-hand domain-containing protein n=1 Tax=Aurantibacter crassamenti TaxID=1837375 RepID=UPI001939A9AB|nr:EF-hand domain-containing protein [Aurantibacter crassamenti]MBM1107763.1 EF-hand domain-containing protein [Aurantibacter crassamenti]